MMLYDALSIWEIAHRWHGHDPNNTNPKALPLEVQDTLRFIARKMAYHELASCSSKGAKHLTHADIASIDEFISWHDDADNLSEGEKDSLYEDYTTQMDKKLTRHNNATDGLERCYEQRIYEKGKLDNIYTLQFELANLCENNGIELPAFWYPEGWRKAYVTSNEAIEENEPTLRQNQIANQLCQAIASTLWAEYPDLTIVQIINHPSIQRYGNGAHYTSRTLRQWIRVSDPRPEEKRRGRPKKS